MTEKELKAAFQALSPEEKARFLEIENREWLESLEYVLKVEGPERVEELLRLLDEYLFRHGVYPANRLSTPTSTPSPRRKSPLTPGTWSWSAASPTSSAGTWP